MRATTAAIVIQDGRVLLGRRKPGGAIGGKWEFPGGKVRRDEQPEQALVREMGEELGTSARVGRLLGSVEFDHGGEHFVLYAYETEIDEVGATPMHDEVRWVSPDDVYDYDLADSDRLLARTLRMLSP